MTTLNEASNHALITPQFVGTAEEIITALGCWSTLVDSIRFLDTRVASYENRAQIIMHLGREVSALEAELENKTSTVAAIAGIPQLKQDIEQAPIVNQENPQVSASGEPIVNLASKYAVPPAFESKLGSRIAKFNETK